MVCAPVMSIISSLKLGYYLSVQAHKPFQGYRGLTGGFLLLQNFSVAISVSPHVCFILVLILISMFLR